MNKACFIIPYFGTLPDTFDIFLRTCQYNPEFDWLIVTDDTTEHPYPQNVHIEYYSFYDFRERVQAHFDFEIALPRPYKICDFRAAFGEIFAKELREYQFWGHCDLDQYFGNIGTFITDEILSEYDKILCLGHFTLFRNCPTINSLFRIEDKKFHQSYQDVFSDERNWIFDEWPTEQHTSINRIMKQEQVRTYYCHDCFCDIIPFVSRFQRYIFNEQIEDWTKESIRNTVFLWQEGRLYCCYIEGHGNVIRKEMLYVHIRQRCLNSSNYHADFSAMYIYPNAIVSHQQVSDANIKKMLYHTKLRSLFRLDELRRKAVLLQGYKNAAIRKFKRFFV